MSRFASELRLENFVKLFTKQIKDQEKLIGEFEQQLNDGRKLLINGVGLTHSDVEQIKHQLSELKISQEKEQKYLRKLKTKLYFYERELNNLRNGNR